MGKNIRALIIEDSEDDALLLVREIQRGGYHVTSKRVDNPQMLNDVLDTETWDIIFCDYSMPHFTGTDALYLMKDKDLDIPFIFVSGTMGEDIAVDAMKAGARDYIVKGNLKRLLPAVDRELHEAKLRLEKKEVEEELRENEELLRSIFNAEPECVNVISPHGTILQVNPAGLAILEISEGEKIIGRSIFRFIANEYKKRFEEFLDRICNGENGIFEFEIIGLRGTRRWLEANAVPLSTSQKRIIAMLSVARDITNRKQAEILQKATYRIAQAAGDSTTLADLFSSVHEIVKEVMEARNFSIALYDEKSDQLSFPYDIDEVHLTAKHESSKKSLTSYVLRTGKSLLCSEKMHRELQQRGEVELAGSPFTIWLGVPLFIEKKPIGVMVVQHYSHPEAYTWREQQILEYVSLEIAKAIERKVAEEKLKQSEEQFRLIAENIADLIAVLDLDGKRIYNSPSYKNILGDPDLLRGTDSFREIHPDDRERIKNLFTETVRTGIGLMAEFRFLLDGEKIRFIESHGSVIKNDNGETEKVVVISRDITEKKVLEQQFLRAQRMESIGTLAGGVAHDLNNVLTPIVMSIEILRKGISDRKYDAILDALKVSANRGTDIVRQVLTFARGVEGERVLVQPKHLILEMEKIVKQTFPKSIRVLVDVPKNLWIVLVDPTQIHQVLLNLCVNARDAMPEGGELRIEAENIEIDEHYSRMHIDAKTGTYIVIYISDSGTGIPSSVKEKIFEPFFTTKGVGKGTGLGLSTVLSIVRSHGGFINVYSEVGKGTKFEVYLPAKTKGNLKSPLERKEEFPIGNGELILIIEDEASIREIAKETLETFGYRVLTANDGAEGIAVYSESKTQINAVVTDMMMPYMDGAAVIHALKRIDPDVKIIAASGITTIGRGDENSDYGVLAFLRKPYTAEKLLKALHTVLTH